MSSSDSARLSMPNHGGSASVKSSKASLRRRVLANLRSLTAHARAEMDETLLGWVRELPGFDQARTLLLYVGALPEEIPTWPLLRDVLAAGRVLVLPRVGAAGLELAIVSSLETQLARGPLGIPQPRSACAGIAPREVDWALVPGVAFGVGGARLGRGAGHYDRLLPLLAPTVPRWAIAYEEQCCEDIITESHDALITGIVTPRRVIFGAPRGGVNSCF